MTPNSVANVTAFLAVCLVFIWQCMREIIKENMQ